MTEIRTKEAATQTTGSIYARGQNKLAKNNLQSKKERERRPAKPPPGPEVCLLLSYLYIYGNVTLAPGKREITQKSSGFPVFLVKLHSAKFYKRTQAQKLSFPFTISIILLIYVKF